MLKQAHIYLADDTKPVIVAAIHHNRDGICYEQDEAVIVPGWRNSTSLVAALRSALQRFSFHDRDLRGLKLSEWPAYRASRCRSVADFQSSYFCITVRAANEAELCYIAEARPLDESEISLCVTIDRYGDDETGRKLLRLYDACSRWSSVMG